MTGINRLNKSRNILCIWLLCVAGFSLLMVACERQPEPIKLGMVASLTGRTADIGVAARDGALLAVEQVNSSGGVQGRPVELLVRDVGNDPDKARLAVQELASLGVFVTIGPVFSSMAIAMAPIADEVSMLLISPTVSTNLLGEKDDMFLRVYPQCRSTAHTLADYAYQKQHRRVVVIAEQKNKAFTEPWQGCFKHRIEELGGDVVGRVDYFAGEGQSFQDLARKALQKNPDSLLIIGSAIDAAMIAQQVAKEKVALQIYVSEWSFTPDLLAHGGRSVEGVTLFHTYNEQSQNSRYLKFAEDFERRFGRKPSFPAVHAFDATGVALTGLQQGAQTGSDLKQDILKFGEFEALQSTFDLNRFGDVDRMLYLTEVRNGKFVVISEQKQKLKQ
jgi:branched-chain amino acid transport system substrate-binding protein